MLNNRIGPVDFEILAVTPSVGGWIAVSIDPPFREFPNVVLFRHQSGHWERVHEGLSIGVQPYLSPFLDTHTQRVALDVTLEGRDEISDDVLDAIERSAAKSGLVAVPHQHFVHSHPVGGEGYFLDRRLLLSIASKLYPEYATYRTDACEMFDYPILAEVKLENSADGLRLTGTTRTGQLWNVTWSGVDPRGRLSGKNIEATWLPTRNENPQRPRLQVPASCSGSAPERLRHELAVRAGQSRGCYEYELRRDPKLEGRVVVNVQVSSEGHTLYSKIEEPGGLSAIADCVAGAFLRPYLNGAEGDCATIRVPISFSKKKSSASP
jgi:hypothetical protein